jgi:peptidyl-prolyl cis-trans isomerase A (cyclophilin A)
MAAMKARWLYRLAAVAMLFATYGCSKSTPGSSSETANGSPVDTNAPQGFNVKLETSKGPIVIAVDRSWSPKGADRFYTLVRRGFYDQARFFRVVPGFVVQFGMHANPEENAKWSSAEIADDPPGQPNLKGTVSFASRGPNTRTTQIFINLVNNSDKLDGQGFTPFGRVTQGMDLVEQINAEYGQSPEQQLIQVKGNAYLIANFPKLDYIQKATVAP